MADKQAKDWDKTLFNLDKFFSFIPPKGANSVLDRRDKILNFWTPRCPVLLGLLVSKSLENIITLQPCLIFKSSSRWLWAEPIILNPFLE